MRNAMLSYGVKRIIEDLGFYVGTIVGAGIFALPYAVARAGVVWGGFFFIVALILLTFFHVVYGRVIYATEEKHRLPGYVRALIGKNAGIAATLSMLVGFYGVLLVYGALAGTFLYDITGAQTPFWWTLIFFGAFSLPLLFSLERIGMINFFLTLPLIGFILFLFAQTFPLIDASHFSFSFQNPDWFLPYGIFLFAFAGASAIPEMVEVFHPRRDGASKRDKRAFEHTVISGSFIIALLYLLFIITVVGISGSATSPEALVSLKGHIAPFLLRIGQIMAFLAVATSFLAIGTDLRSMFRYDYKIPLPASWFLVIIGPISLFLFGFGAFIPLIAFLGAVTIALDSIFILWLGMKKNIISRAVALPVGLALLAGIVVFLIS